MVDSLHLRNDSLERTIVVQLRCKFLCYFFFLKFNAYFVLVFVGDIV